MEYKDYYRILGVDKSASEKDIKSAFRKLARKHHPDMNQGDRKSEERFKEINEAYEVLSDPEKRRRYDQLGADWQRWQGAGGQASDFDWSRWTGGQGGQGRPYVRYGTPEDLQDLFGGGGAYSDFFSQIFSAMGGGAGGVRQQARPQRGQDLEQAVEITLDEAYHGTKRILQKDTQRLEIKIPAGAKTGTRVRISGEGGTGSPTAAAGDLYLKVTVLPDPRFERKDDDLHTMLPVDLYTLMLGGDVHVPTLDGELVLTIPPETQNGRTFRLRGKGMPRLNQPDSRGDLFARVEVHLPARLTPQQKELFEELRRTAV